MKDTFYMQHDTNASRDDAIVWMRSEYGAYGYGLYWLINEYMRDQTGCKVSLDRVGVIAYALNEDREKLEQFVDDCIKKYKLYKADKDYFWSERLVKDKQALDNIREVNRQNGQRGGRPKQEPNKNPPVSEEKPTANPPVSENEAIVKQEKRREEKRREENIYTSENSKFTATEILSIQQIYNATCTSLPKCQRVNERRGKHIGTLLNEFTFDEIATAFRKAESSDFLTGKKTEWQANFDWLINKNNLIKVIEGAYDNKQKKPAADINAGTSDWEGIRVL